MTKTEGNKIWVSYQRKINIGDYQSVDVSAGATIDLEEGEDTTEAVQKLAKEVKAAHRRMVARVMKEHDV